LSQYDYEYAFDEEDWDRVAENNRYDQYYCMKVEISSLSGDFGVEKFLNWLAECDRLYKYTGISYSRMVKTAWFI